MHADGNTAKWKDMTVGAYKSSILSDSIRGSGILWLICPINPKVYTIWSFSGKKKLYRFAGIQHQQTDIPMCTTTANIEFMVPHTSTLGLGGVPLNTNNCYVKHK